MNSKPAVLIMTATITPPSYCPDLSRTDPIIRLNDYCEALKFYLTVSPRYIDRVIFVENSDSDLESLRRIAMETSHGKDVEFISYSGGNRFPPEYGKGYGEMMMMNYALDTSKIISKSDVIWKATGRLILLNIEKLIQKAPYPYEIYCDLHNSFKTLYLQSFFDPRFYSFTTVGYDKHFRLEPNMLTYSHIEHLYFEIISNRIPDSKIVPRFNRQPMISGYAAAENSNYSTLKKKAQRLVQQTIRYVAPSVWL